MRGLIIKDLYIARKTLLIYFGAMVLNSLFFVIVGTILFLNEDFTTVQSEGLFSSDAMINASKQALLKRIKTYVRYTEDNIEYIA